MDCDACAAQSAEALQISSQPVMPPPIEPVAVVRAVLDDQHVDGQCTLRWWRGGWLRWIGTHWTEIETKEVEADLYARLEHAVYWNKPKNGDPKLLPWLPDRRSIADLVHALGAVTYLPEGVDTPSWLDGPVPAPAGEMVVCANGVLEVRARHLHPATPRLFTRVSVPFDYDDCAAEPTKWLCFLSELWPNDSESVLALQEWFGYVLSGRTDLHKILLLIGPTRAGKGVVARVLTELVGRRNVAGPTLASLGTNFGLAPLLSRSLALVSDARLGGANVHQVVERLLSVSGEDMLTVDRKYREPWTGRLPARLMVLSNELPRLGDASGAIANRFVLLALRQSFLGRERPTLTDELVAELPGILRWALDGLDRLIGQGRFTEPQISRDAIVALQDLVSPVAAFVRDCCDRGPDREVGMRDLFKAYQRWCSESGHRSGSEQTFGKDLRAAVPDLQAARPRMGGDRVRIYRSIALRPVSDAGAGPVGHNAGPRGPRADPLSSSPFT